MAHFTFKAKNSDGEIYKGEKDVADRFELYKILRESNSEIIEYKERSSAKGIHLDMNIAFLSRVKMIEKINFARNLGLMLVSGLSLSRALAVIEKQSKSKFFKSILTEVMTEVNKGSTFSDALSMHPKVFPQIFSSMVHAGEQSGTLSESLKSIAGQMESSYNLERRVRGAMMYPMVIFIVMIVIGVLMFIYVVPSLSKVFLELNVELPLSTRIIIGLSDLIKNNGLITFITIALVAAGIWFWSKKKSGKRFIHAVNLKLPIIGNLVQEVNSARTARTLSSLLSAGVNVVESVNITATIVQNLYFRDVLVQAEEAIKKGEPMSQVFSSHDKLYPIFFAEMLSVGEETGKIGDMLQNVSTYYENDVEQKTKDMSTIIEPILMVVIGVAVGFFAVSMISPIYSLVNVIQ